MVTLLDRRPTRHCQGYSRRELLKVGALGLGGLTLPGLLAAQAKAKADGRPITGKSVVLLFLHGGPTHIELFDPKMTAPSEIRSITGEVQTKLPGITFGGTFPRMAAIADKLAVVRSYASGNSGHTYQVANGNNPLKAAMGSLYAKVAGTNHPQTGMPSNVLVKPEAVQEGLTLKSNFETGALPSLTDPGELGPSFGAFDSSGGGVLKENMELRMEPSRLGDRRNLLAGLDRLRREVDHSGQLDGADKFRQQAFDVITRGVADAFDLSKEDPRTLERYDTSKLFALEDVTRWYDMARATNLLGKQMLLARRLCEAGCGFVSVSDCGWDWHANNNSPKHMTGIYQLGAQVDHAVATFVEDLHERGLQDDILLIVTGEMGRSPRLNKNGGRDHYGGLTSLVFAGGGLSMGQVIGQSDEQATRPATTPYGPHNLLATVLHTLFDTGTLRITPGVPREIVRMVETGQPIDHLLS
jgi:hypothetical protein